MRRHSTRKINPLAQQFLKLCETLKQDNKLNHNKKSKRRPPVHQHVDHYKLGKQHPGAYLTGREAECVTLLLEGYSDEKISRLLHVSPRTIEYYLRKVKEKMHCKSKTEIVDKVKQTNFMRYVTKVKNLLLPD